MAGFKNAFLGSNMFWVSLVLLTMIAVNCNNGCGCNGCTTSVVVDQEARKLKADGVKMKLTANKNRVTNRKLKYNENLYIDKTVWFSIDYHLKIEKRPAVKNICEFDVPENQDMEKALDRFNVRFSPDKKHVAVGLDDMVYEFFHLFDKGVPFSSGCFYLNDSNYTFMSTARLSFNQINWKKFPKPEDLFDKIIIPNHYSVFTLSHNLDNILELLREMKPGNRHEMTLIENWYCEIAKLHFNQARVEEIVKVSPEWKIIALKRLLYEIDNSVSENDPELESSLDMMLWINDSKSLHQTDSILLDDYFAEGFAGNYFIARLQNKQIPPKTSITKSLREKAKEICQGFEKSKSGMSDETAFDILFIFNENALLKDFLDKMLVPEKIADNYTNIASVTIKKYPKYPPEFQKIMATRYLEIAKRNDLGLSSFDLGEIAEFLKDKVSCKELKTLVEIHKDNLFMFKLPQNCE